MATLAEERDTEIVETAMEIKAQLDIADGALANTKRTAYKRLCEADEALAEIELRIQTLRTYLPELKDRARFVDEAVVHVTHPDEVEADRRATGSRLKRR